VVRQHGTPVPPPPGPPSGPVLVDLELACDSAATGVTLHRQHGSVAGPTDFSAIDSTLDPGDTVSISVGGGRSSEGCVRTSLRTTYTLTWPSHHQLLQLKT
jgi:hypothetical protein